MITKTCKCGATIECRTNHRRVCDKCKRDRHLARQKAYNREHLTTIYKHRVRHEYIDKDMEITNESQYYDGYLYAG